MSDDAGEGDVRDVLGAIWRRKLVVLGVVAASIAVAAGLTSRQEDEYEATATVLLDPMASALADPSRLAGRDADRLLSNERLFLESDALREAVATRVGVPEDELGDVATELRDDGDAIEITATTTDAASAAVTANAYADAYLELRRGAATAELAAARAVITERIAEIDAQLATIPVDPTTADARNVLLDRRAGFQRTADDLDYRAALPQATSSAVLARAVEPTKPAGPNLTQNLTLAAVVGLLVGIAAALARDSADRSIRSGNIGAVVGGPPLAIVPAARRRGRTEPVTEAYRSLRLAVETAAADHPIRVIQIVSPRDTPLVAQTVVQLGTAFERAGNRVVLVSANLRNPRLHELVRMPVAPGLSSLLKERPHVQQLLRTMSEPSTVSVLTAGDRSRETIDLLSSKRLDEVFEQLRESAEVVLVESAALLPYADSLELARLVDATVVVAESSRTRIADLRRATELLDGVGASPLGYVLHGR